METEDLTQKVCRACEGYEKPMDKSEAEEYLEKVKDWKLDENNIFFKLLIFIYYSC